MKKYFSMFLRLKDLETHSDENHRIRTKRMRAICVEKNVAQARYVTQSSSALHLKLTLISFETNTHIKHMLLFFFYEWTNVCIDINEIFTIHDGICNTWLELCKI